MSNWKKKLSRRIVKEDTKIESLRLTKRLYQQGKGKKMSIQLPTINRDTKEAWSKSINELSMLAITSQDDGVKNVLHAERSYYQASHCDQPISTEVMQKAANSRMQYESAKLYADQNPQDLDAQIYARRMLEENMIATPGAVEAVPGNRVVGSFHGQVNGDDDGIEVVGGGEAAPVEIVS